MSTTTLEGLDTRVAPRRTTPRDHRISRRDAAALVRRFRESAPAGALVASMFGRSIFDAILAQDGCRGIRVHYAMEPDGSRTLVLVGVEANGADMWDGVLGEEHFPCPPFCPPGPGFDSSLALSPTNIAPHILTRHDHRITRQEAKDLIARYRERSDRTIRASMFYRAIFDELLAQKGCTGIRLHYALEPDGSPTLVLVGVDSNGADMWNGVLGENHWPCPPFCPPGPGFDD